MSDLISEHSKSNAGIISLRLKRLYFLTQNAHIWGFELKNIRKPISDLKSATSK